MTLRRNQVLSPYKDVGWHLQFEALSDFTIAHKNVTTQTTVHLFTGTISTTGYIAPSVDSTTIRFQNIKQRTINIVPLQLRKDIGNFLSIGAGVSADVYFQTINQTDSIRIIYFYLDNIQKRANSRAVRPERQETQFRVAPFGDIALGYEGFRVGLRYTYPLAARRQDYFQLYSYYKF
jgi:hypothetical protein